MNAHHQVGRSFSKLPFRWDIYGLVPYKGWLMQYVNLLRLRSNIVSDRFPPPSSWLQQLGKLPPEHWWNIYPKDPITL